MNYSQVESLMRTGINIFSDGDGIFTMETGKGGVEIVDGVEAPATGGTALIKGLVREIKTRDIDGEYIQFGDKRGIFTSEVPIIQGYRIIVDDETYTVVDPRPVKPTGTVVAYRPILRRVATYG